MKATLSTYIVRKSVWLFNVIFIGCDKYKHFYVGVSIMTIICAGEHFLSGLYCAFVPAKHRGRCSDSPPAIYHGCYNSISLHVMSLWLSSLFVETLQSSVVVRETAWWDVTRAAGWQSHFIHLVSVALDMWILHYVTNCDNWLDHEVCQLTNILSSVETHDEVMKCINWHDSILSSLVMMMYRVVISYVNWFCCHKGNWSVSVNKGVFWWGYEVC